MIKATEKMTQIGGERRGGGESVPKGEGETQLAQGRLLGYYRAHEQNRC